MPIPSPKITITGPYDKGGTAQGPATDLYLGDEASVDTDTETNKEDLPGFDSDETLLNPLQGAITFSYSGVFNAQRLYQAGLGASLEEAMYEWIFRLETLVGSRQGIGWKLVDKLNGFSPDPTSGVGVLIEESEWSLSEGELYKGEWRVDAKLTKGRQDVATDYRTDDISERNTAQDTSISEPKIEYGGNTLKLHHAEDFSVTRSVDLETNKLAHEYDIPQVGLVQSGVDEVIRVSGQVTERDEILSNWAEEANKDAHGSEIKLYDPFSKRIWGGTISTSMTEFSERPDNRLEYDFEIDVGRVLNV